MSLFLPPPQLRLGICSKTSAIAATLPLLSFVKAPTFSFLWWVGCIGPCPRLEKYGQSLVFSTQILKTVRRTWSQFSAWELLWWRWCKMSSVKGCLRDVVDQENEGDLGLHYLPHMCPVDKEGKLLSRSSRIFLLLLILQEAVIENRSLWLLLKKIFRYHSKSHYKRLQRVLEKDSAWPPLNETFISDSVAISVEENIEGHSNPTFDSNEGTLWRKLQRTHIQDCCSWL